MNTTKENTEPKANDEKTDDLMGYEGQLDTPKETEVAVAPSTTPDDVQTIINKAVKEVTVDDNGKYVYPEDMNPMLKAAVAATKSYRDNQSGFTKSQQSLKESEAEAEALREKLATYTSKSLELTKEDKVELDGLKVSDPDAWRAKMNLLEQESKTAIQDELDTVTDEVRAKASGEFELNRRYEYLESFNVGREHPITPEILDSEIPPRITKQLAEGKLTFESYLDEVSEYLSKGKVVASSPSKETTNLNKAGGSTAPSESSKEKQKEIDYSSMTF